MYNVLATYNAICKCGCYVSSIGMITFRVSLDLSVLFGRLLSVQTDAFEFWV